MRLLCKAWLPLAALLVLPALAVAGDQPATKPPSVVFRVRSIDALFEVARFGAGMVDKADFAEQIEQLIKNRDDGIDFKKPIGFYGQFGKDIADATAVLLLPVSDEKALLDALNGFNIQPKKGDDGVYTVQLPNVPVPAFFRFSGGYAYVTAMKKDAITGKLPSPKSVFAAARDTLVSASARLDQIPEGIKGVVLDQLDLKLAEAMEKDEPNETPAQKEFRVRMIKSAGTEFKALIEEGGAVEAAFDIDTKAKKATFEGTLKGKAGTKLAKQIAGLAEQKSLFGGLTANAAMSGLLHVALPPALREALGKALDDEFAKSLKKVDDEGKRQLAEKLIKAISPTLKEGELDAGFLIRGPSKDNRYTMLLGLKVKNAAEAGRTLTEVLQEALKTTPEADREKVKLNAMKIGGISVHRLEFQATYDEKARKIFGENPVLLAFSDKAALLAVGPEAEAVLKQAASATPATTPIARLELNYGRLYQIGLLTEEDRALAKKILGDGQAGVLTLTVQGGPALSVRFDANLGLLQFFAEKNKAALGGQ
jgi:hypothetical protein